MPNFLKDNNYNHDQVKEVKFDDIKELVTHSFNAVMSVDKILAKRDELNLLKVVLDKNMYVVDGFEVLYLAILDRVETISAVILE